MVTIEVPESASSTFIEEVRLLEESLTTGIALPLPTAFGGEVRKQQGTNSTS
jgi:hypothetical protein